MNMRTKPTLNLIESIKFGIIKSFNFRGRSRRSEFWYYFLFLILIIFLFLYFFLNVLVHLSKKKYGVLLFPFVSAFLIFVTVSFLSLIVRRLHDIGKSTWSCFYFFIPILGAILFFFFMMKDSTPEKNKYGDSPKHVKSDYPEQQIHVLNNVNPSLEQMNNLNINNQLSNNAALNPDDFQMLNDENPILPPLVPNEDNQPGIYMNN